MVLSIMTSIPTAPVLHHPAKSHAGTPFYSSSRDSLWASSVEGLNTQTQCEMSSGGIAQTQVPTPGTKPLEFTIRYLHEGDMVREFNSSGWSLLKHAAHTNVLLAKICRRSLSKALYFCEFVYVSSDNRRGRKPKIYRR